VLSPADLAAIRRIVREEVQRALASQAREPDEYIDEGMRERIRAALNPEPDPEPLSELWMEALAAEPDENKRLAMERARSYMRGGYPLAKQARRFLGLSMNADLSDEQMLTYARHHAERWERARAKNLATRAAKRDKRS